MQAQAAAALEPGTIVRVPFGANRSRRMVLGEVVKASAVEKWGRGMRPANATAETPLCVVTVRIGGRMTRSFGNSLVEVAV